jgi:hypothetical protein
MHYKGLSFMLMYKLCLRLKLVASIGMCMDFLFIVSGVSVLALWCYTVIFDRNSQVMFLYI